MPTALWNRRQWLFTTTATCLYGANGLTSTQAAEGALFRTWTDVDNKRQIRGRFRELRGTAAKAEVVITREDDETASWSVPFSKFCEADRQYVARLTEPPVINCEPVILTLVEPSQFTSLPITGVADDCQLQIAQAASGTQVVRFGTSPGFETKDAFLKEGGSAQVLVMFGDAPLRINIKTSLRWVNSDLKVFFEPEMRIKGKNVDLSIKALQKPVRDIETAMGKRQADITVAQNNLAVLPKRIAELRRHLLPWDHPRAIANNDPINRQIVACEKELGRSVRTIKDGNEFLENSSAPLARARELLSVATSHSKQIELEFKIFRRVGQLSQLAVASRPLAMNNGRQVLANHLAGMRTELPNR